MAGVSAESNAQFIAFRRLVYSFSEQVSKDEQKTIIYIRLYQLKERYKDSTMLEVLSKLEADGVFGPSSPEGLIEVAKDIKRQDLASEVKHFIKKRLKAETKGGLSSLSAATARLTKNKVPQPPSSGLSPSHQYGGEPDSAEDLQLKATIEVTLAQTTVLMQQVEKLERAVAGGQAQRQRAKEAISEAAQTAATLADRLKKAQTELGIRDTTAADATENTVTSITRPTTTTVQAEELGVVSHPVPVGVSNSYALQPHSRSPLTHIPEKLTQVDTRSKINPAIERITEEDEEDDYEKMQSYAVKEETIRAWRMSQISNAASSYGSFTPPSLQSRKSEHFGSYPSSTPQMPTIRPRSELRLPHSPSSQHNLQVPTTSKGGGVQKRSNVVPSTQTTASPNSNSPWSRSQVSNINTNTTTTTTTTNSSRYGNTTTQTPQTSHSANHVGTTKSSQRPTTQGTSAAASQVASNSPRVLTTKATVEGISIDGSIPGKDSTAKRVTHPPPPVPQLPPKSKATSSPIMNRSPGTTRKHSSPTLPKKPNPFSGNSATDGSSSAERQFAGSKSSKEAAGSTGIQQEEESTKAVNMVKARLERLEQKASTPKPALTQKPRPVITPRKKISGSWTLNHNSSLQKEPNNNKMPSKTATLPHSITCSPSSSTSSLKLSTQPQSKARLNSSSSEDDAYILLHPSSCSGTSITGASALYTGDSGFEDVRPLQRLDQEVDNDGGESSEPAIPTHPGTYTSLLEKRRAIPDQDGYTAVNYTP